MRSSNITKTAVAALLATVAIPAPAATAQTVAAWHAPAAFAIPAGDLRQGLSAFSRATGLQVIVAPKDVAGRRSTAVSGRIAARTALATMLRGTGLTARLHGGLIVLKPGVATPEAPTRPTPVAAVAPAVVAQDLPVEEAPGEIVVTGLRKSLESAAVARRDAIGLTDSIFAKDIAAFPDTNVAESIQRIPGVQITRDAGEGRQIAVRGLNADFTRVRLNGMEALATTGTTDQRGAVNRSRSFDFNIFASELFSRIDVVKARSPSLDEGGIAATVDLHTLRPFDNPGFHVVASGQAFWATRTDDVGPRAALVVSKTTDDGVWGGLISAAYSRRQVIEDGHQTLRWASGGWNLANVASTVDPATRARLNGTGPDRLFYPRTPRYFIFDHDQKRLGLTGAFQFRPSDALHVDLDLLYAHLKSSRLEYFLDSQSFSRTDANGLPQTTIKNIVVEGNDIVAGEFGNVDNRADNRRDLNDTKFHQIALTTTWKPTDRLTIDMLAGMEGSDYRVDTRTLQLLTNNRDFSYDYRANDRVPVMGYGFSLTDPSAMQLDLYRPRVNVVDNDYRIGKLNLTWRANDAVTMKGGGSFTRYVFDTADYGQDVTSVRGRGVADLVHTTSPYTFGKALDLPEGSPSEWLYIDFDKALPLIDPTNTALTRNRENDRRVKEEVLAGYAQLDLTGQIAGLTVRADAGVRVARTRTTATGAVIVGGVAQAVTFEREYTDWLPSANMVVELSPKVQVRASANRNITRPTLTSLTPGGQVQVNTRTVSVGNPDLEPFRADSLDLALEFYPSRDGFFAIGPFYKQIGSFITNQTTEQTYAASGYPIAFLGNQSVAQPDSLFLFTQPVNGKGTSLKGLEVIAQQAFTFLPGALRHFGGMANYTLTSSDTDYALNATTSVRKPLIGLSRHSANATLYYETPVYGGRVSGNYRSRYLTAVPGANGNDIAGVNAATYVDASLFWNVTPRLTVTLEGVNLTNQAEDQFVDSSDRVSSYAQSGRQLLAGVRWRM
ncbi:TonB-dependent receptor [Sphingomonas sp. CFBP 13720]|uniref:TonB-dependent receptor n=1 Tax=Sphingomonas sp. CFBP 13720 TaxID=2775302 RepID=UPI001784CECE|nr:TonB-dependent receptor [Sphingomonas sp. CFBP 13720]MBD8679685.1 TonB-dependent receptor [Sphingomonas sp. CFBP 13720]